MSDQLDMFDVYRSMLRLARMETTSEGFVRMEIEPGEYIPVTAKDRKMVVLPLDERLRDPNVKDYEVFHLLRDNGPKDSDLLARYRHWLINRFNLVIGGLGSVILKFIADKEITKRLSPHQKDFLDLIVDADAGSLERWKDIDETIKAWNNISEVAAKPNQIQQVFVSLYLSQATTLRGQSYHRVAVVNFPFYDELVRLDAEAQAYKAAPKTKKPPKPVDEVFGCEVKVKDRQPFIGLMRYLIPSLDIPHQYDVGSNSRIAPSVDAMMMAWLPIATHLNAISEKLMGVDPTADRILKEAILDLSWVEAFENLDALWPQIRSVPAQATGVINEPAPEAVDPRKRVQAQAVPAAPAYPTTTPPWEPQPAPAPLPYQPAYSAPYQQPPVPQQSGGPMSVNDLNRMLGGGRPATPYPQQQPVYQSGYSQPAYPQNNGYLPPNMAPRRY
jgi:hypothetical protein